MKHEIGGYFGLMEFCGTEYHSGLIALNCARNALTFLLKARAYQKLYIPRFLCDSVREGAEKAGVEIVLYSVGEKFSPLLNYRTSADEAVYIVNYYGQLSDECLEQYQRMFGNIIVDNVQSFFQRPLPQVDTIYSCRKYFGVADGAYLSANIFNELEEDRSADHMLPVLGRCDIDASSYYADYIVQEKRFSSLPVRAMSLLTHNLLRAIDYEMVAAQRSKNAGILHVFLGKRNALSLDNLHALYMYPFCVPGHGSRLRKYLHQYRIYVPCLWPEVLRCAEETSVEYLLARDIVPLPCDQRYDEDDMMYIVRRINEYMGDYHDTADSRNEIVPSSL